MTDKKTYLNIGDKAEGRLNENRNIKGKQGLANPNVFEITNKNCPEIVFMSTDQIRQTEEYEKRVTQVIQNIGISPNEFARYPGAYIITNKLKEIKDNRNEAQFLNESLSKEHVLSKDGRDRPIELYINEQVVFLEWDDNKISSIKYKGHAGNDTKVVVPRDSEGKILFGDLGEPLSGRDIPYQVLAESIAKNIRELELGDNRNKRIMFSEIFLRNRTELSGFFSRFAQEKEKLGIELTRKTVMVVIKAFEGNDKSSQMGLRMNYRRKHGSPSEVKDAEEAERLNSQYELTPEDILALEGSEVIDDVISVDNTSTLELETDSVVVGLEENIKSILLHNSEIIKLVEECKHGNVDVFITGPVASGKSAVAKVLKRMVSGKE